MWGGEKVLYIPPLQQLSGEWNETNQKREGYSANAIWSLK